MGWIHNKELGLFFQRLFFNQKKSVYLTVVFFISISCNLIV